MSKSTSTSTLATASSISKRGLDLRRSDRLRKGGKGGHDRIPNAPSRAAARERSEHYAQRVMAGEFEPTALRARRIAEDRGLTLHQLAHQLGYAGAPPARTVRGAVRVVINSIPRSVVATRTGYHISDISRMIARKHPPTLTKLAKVAEVYGVTMDEMLTALGW